MYIIKKDITHLHMYLAGYSDRLHESDHTFYSKFDDFGDFVNKYYNTDSDGASWADVITRHEGNEEQAFEKFYELFDVFINS